MVTAIVLAAGRSTRMGAGPNKQFLELHGRPLLHYSLAAFQACPAVAAIVIVRRPDYAGPAAQLGQGFSKVTGYTDGGPERQDSVWNGLDHCPAGTQIVAVHDGARPLARADLCNPEIGDRQDGAVRPLLEAAGWSGVTVERDLQGLPRIALARN